MQDSPNGFLAFLQENTAERNWIGDHLIAKLDTALNSDTRAALAIFNPQLSGYARRSQKRNRMEEQNADRFHSRRSNSPQ